MMMTVAGRLVLRPGSAASPVSSSRREWAPRVAAGLSADALPDLLAAVFSLCAGAHRVASALAVAAARGQCTEASAAQRTALQRDTVREHLKRWWLEWPPQGLGESAPSASAGAALLAASPWWRNSGHASADEQRRWVETHVVGARCEAWAQAWNADPAGCAHAWSAEGSTLPAQVLASARHTLAGIGTEPRALPVPAPGPPAHQAAALATLLREVPGYAMEPHWDGEPAETGPWTRQADPRVQAGPPNPCAAAWMRAASRVADVVRCVSGDSSGAPALAIGATAVGPREGLAWCEMARGLLVHHVCLDERDTVTGCHVIAPTEWNFHPHGALARLTAALPPDAPEQAVRWLAAAFDPCVEVLVERPHDGTHI